MFFMEMDSLLRPLVARGQVAADLAFEVAGDDLLGVLKCKTTGVTVLVIMTVDTNHSFAYKRQTADGRC